MTDVVAVIGGILTILLALGAIGVGMWKMYRRVDGWNDAQKVASRNEDRLEAVEGKLDAAIRSLRTITDQVTSNGGNSMLDKVDRLTDAMTIHQVRGDERHAVIDTRLSAFDRHFADIERDLGRREGRGG